VIKAASFPGLKPEIKSETLRTNIALVTRVVISLCLLFLSVALLVGATNNAFIYTRF